MSRKTYTEKGRIEFGGHVDNQPATPKDDEPTKAERESCLVEVTLESMGKPDDLTKVDIKELWDRNHYRINVYREIKGFIKLTDSFFVTMTTDEGVTSSPPMEKKYYDADLELLSLSAIA